MVLGIEPKTAKYMLYHVLFLLYDLKYRVGIFLMPWQIVRFLSLDQQRKDSMSWEEQEWNCASPEHMRTCTQRL
jgi:hypothetical protein